MKISDKVIKEHGLTPEEFDRIRSILGRDPNIVELGVFSVMWSEHCSYKSSRQYLKGFPTKGPRVLQGPGENAGVVDIGGGLAAVFKMESHNHPSFIEPYQGAATGVGGILRDIFTMGARPVASLNSLRFGPMENPRTAFLLEGVVSGIAGYGNCMGVPTVGGEVYFNECYGGNCLVNVMTLGIVRKDKIFKGKAEGVGNSVMYVGSKTGRDGIHGAVMASDVFGEGGEQRRPTVQVGDPFSEKLLLEACLELFKTDYVVGIQDMGAAGLTSSSVEMAGRGGSGIEIDVDRVPRRETGMNAYEVLLSESQERMLLVVRPGTEADVKRIFAKWDLDAEVIGKVTDSKKIRVIEGGKVAAEIPIGALTDDAPVYNRAVRKPDWQDSVQKFDVSSVKEPADYNDALLKVVSCGNIASKEWIYRQYDHMVRTDTVVEPGSDAAVIRVKGTDRALAMTVDCNPVYCYLDPYQGGAIAVAEAARNLAVSGASPIALTDCLNFGNPERPDVMWQFKQAVDGIKAACHALGVPVIGGNVSLYNETSGRSIHPTPTIGMVGLIEDPAHITTQWFKQDGHIIAVIGAAAQGGLSGSAYLQVIQGLEAGTPSIDLLMEKNVQDSCLTAIKAGIIVSAHDISDGGLAAALAECCFNPDASFGAQIEQAAIDMPGLRADEVLFGESQSRIIVSLTGSNVKKLTGICSRTGVAVKVIGKVTKDARLKIGAHVDMPVDRLKQGWAHALERSLTAHKAAI